MTNLVVTPTFTNPGTGSFKLTLAATGDGSDHVHQGHRPGARSNLSVSNEVVWGVKKLELALALDVTGSMASNNKMTELKKAAKSLLTTLKSAAKKDGDIKVSIVPFAVVVNAGAANVNASHWTGATGVRSRRS